MIYYPIQTLIDSGINDILLVCGGNGAGEFLRVLGNGEAFGIKRLHYTYQKDALGIAHALGLAREFCGDEPLAVMLADNILEKPVVKEIKEFDNHPFGARIFLTESSNPSAYGVVEADHLGRVKSIEEKPSVPRSNEVAIGLYLYDTMVWDFIDKLEPSARGELEVTDLNNFYLKNDKLLAHRISCEWFDCGESIDGYLISQVAAQRWNGQKNK